MEKLKSSTAMSRLCCITNLIHFMMNESKKLMKGSVHKNNFIIIHDALVLMTEKEKIKWMIQNCYLHRWLLPLDMTQDRSEERRVVLHCSRRLQFVHPPLSISLKIHIFRFSVVLERWMGFPL